ncbi:hypothetical protein FHG87_010705 [Trinorchestia longiramus]|nr:hypothetical protein FHG87_010705 [Trinorchestia longiramus]
MARKYSSTKNCPINNRSVTAVLDVLARCAQSAVLSDNFQIEIACSSMRELDECCKEYDVDLDEFLSAYLQFVKDPDDKKRHYSFFHRTEMEFLTGKYLANKSMSSVVQEKGYEKLQMYYGVLPFLVGQLGATGKLDKYAPVIIELLQCMQVSTDNFNFYSKLVIESTTSNNHGSGCRRPFCSQLCDLISHKEWHLEAETVLSGLHLLLHCACLDLDLLVIDLQMSCDPDKAECLRYLKNNLSKLQGAFGHGKHCRKLDLCLYIQNHYEKKDAGVSDDYLSLVLGWTNLVKFTGAIGTEGIKHLSKFVYIKHLDLRMSKSDVFNDFVKKCFAECKKLKQLQLILDFPTKTEPSSLVPLDCVPLKVHTDVRLRFDRIARKNLPWALCVIDAICPKSLGGFDRVTFHSTNFNREKDADLIIEALKDKVFMKVIVTSHASSRGQFNIIQKDKCPFEFEFDDR